MSKKTKTKQASEDSPKKASSGEDSSPKKAKRVKLCDVVSPRTKVASKAKNSIFRVGTNDGIFKQKTRNQEKASFTQPLNDCILSMKEWEGKELSEDLEQLKILFIFNRKGPKSEDLSLMNGEYSMKQYASLF